MRWIQSTANAYAVITASDEPEPLQRQPPRRDVARAVEVVAAGEQQRQDHDRGERAVVDAVQTWSVAESAATRDRDLPRAVAPPHEAARGDEQRDRRDDAERVRERADSVGREVAHEPGVRRRGARRGAG